MATLARCSPSVRRLALGIVLLLSIDAPSSSTAPRRSPAAAAGASASIQSVSFESRHDDDDGGGDAITKKASNEEGGRGELAAAAAVAGGAERWCTLDELLPLKPEEGAAEGLSSEWSDEHVVEAPFGCDCASTKSRYFCPKLGSGGYPKWVPQAVARGDCKSVTRSDMSNGIGPLPPGFKVLLYGNSYMRQVMESIMCVFEDKIAVKRVSLYSSSSPSSSGKAGGGGGGNGGGGGGNEASGTWYNALVEGDAPCRACVNINHPFGVTMFETMMLENGCITDAEGCRCHDDHAEFFFENGAVVHYYFADREHDKSVKNVLKLHGGVPLAYYDVVFANNGNPPTMPASSALDVADELRAAGVQLFWLSTYEGHGDIGKPEFMDDRQRDRFRESGARYVGVDRMTQGLKHLTRGAVQNNPDPHFCLPGPPTEIGLLLLKLAWAEHHREELE